MADWDRNTPWRQGHLLKPETIKVLGIQHPEAPDATAVVVISHDCDLAQTCTNEPNVEILVGRFIKKSDGNYTHSKNLRKLHLPYVCSEQQVVVELLATSKCWVPKEGGAGLVGHQPEPKLQLGSNERAILQSWLAARYRRAAFPDEFDRRLNDETALRDRLAKILKLHGHYIPAIFFDVDEGEEVKRTGPDDSYILSIYLLYSTQTDPDLAEKDALKAKDAIVTAFKEECHDKNGKWRWIELRECDVFADIVMTYAQSTLLKKWQADYLSLRGDPPQEMLVT